MFSRSTLCQKVDTKRCLIHERVREGLTLLGRRAHLVTPLPPSCSSSLPLLLTAATTHQTHTDAQGEPSSPLRAHRAACQLSLSLSRLGVIAISSFSCSSCTSLPSTDPVTCRSTYTPRTDGQPCDRRPPCRARAVLPRGRQRDARCGRQVLHRGRHVRASTPLSSWDQCADLARSLRPSVQLRPQVYPLLNTPPAAGRDGVKAAYKMLRVLSYGQRFDFHAVAFDRITSDNKGVERMKGFLDCTEHLKFSFIPLPDRVNPVRSPGPVHPGRVKGCAECQADRPSETPPSRPPSRTCADVPPALPDARRPRQRQRRQVAHREAGGLAPERLREHGTARPPL